MGGDWVLSPLLKFCEMKKRRKINVHLFYPLNSVLQKSLMLYFNFLCLHIGACPAGLPGDPYVCKIFILKHIFKQRRRTILTKC